MPPGSTRKRDHTRADLLIAVQELLLEKTGVHLSIPQIVARADVSQGTFYNYFERLDDILDAVGDLLLHEHARVLDKVTAGSADYAETFARSTRQFLMLFASIPDAGALMFDSGLAVDRLLGGVRSHLHHDLLLGLTAGDFAVSDSEATASMVAGAILGSSLDIHRGRLTISSTPAIIEQLLRALGVSATKATRLSTASQQFIPMRPFPLSPLNGG